MGEMDILFPVPIGGRNADDMGMPAPTKTGAAMATETPRVEALIEAVMARYKGHGTLARARYYEAVHQELAPLARELERENRALRALAVDYATFAGEASKGLHHVDPTWQEMYELGKRLREILMGSNVELTGLRRSYGEGPVERRVGPQTETTDDKN